MNCKNLKIFLYTLIFFSAIFIDRITKMLALNVLKIKDIHVTNFLNLTLVRNRGVSWGLFSFKSPFAFKILALIIAIIIILFFLFIMRSQKESNCQRHIFFEILILAGAFSNLLDRFLYKSVIDFIDFYYYSWHWPTFNFADVCVVVGVFGILGRYFYNVYLRKNKASLF